MCGEIQNQSILLIYLPSHLSIPVEHIRCQLHHLHFCNILIVSTDICSIFNKLSQVCLCVCYNSINPRMGCKLSQIQKIVQCVEKFKTGLLLTYLPSHLSMPVASSKCGYVTESMIFLAIFALSVVSTVFCSIFTKLSYIRRGVKNISFSNAQIYLIQCGAGNQVLK